MRVFIGIPIDKDLLHQLQAWVIEAAETEWGEQVRWVPPHNYHLTLRFIGAKIPEDKIHFIQEGMQSWFLEGMSAFDAPVLKIQRFPNKVDGRFIVAIVDHILPLQYLVDEIQQHLKPLGFTRPQQAFRPHITLGRLPKANEALLSHILTLEGDLRNHQLKVEQLNLYESVLTDDFPVYKELASKALEDY